MTNTLLAGLVLALSAVALAPQSTRPSRMPAPPCANTIEHEPVLLYEISGGTLTGPVDSFLSLYGDGSARLSSSLGGAGLGSSQFTSVTPAEVEALRSALIAAGALEACDEDFPTNDAPQQTLTLFRPGSHRANTFSWSSPEGNLAEIQVLLGDFQNAHFAPLPGGSES